MPYWPQQRWWCDRHLLQDCQEVYLTLEQSDFPADSSQVRSYLECKVATYKLLLRCKLEEIGSDLGGRTGVGEGRNAAVITYYNMHIGPIFIKWEFIINDMKLWLYLVSCVQFQQTSWGHLRCCHLPGHTVWGGRGIAEASGLWDHTIFEGFNPKIVIIGNFIFYNIL